jgi:hypothetical protein
MPIIIPAGFSVGNNEPIDSRVSVADATARKAFSPNNVYEGLLVYQRDNNKFYKLINASAPSADASWVELPESLNISLATTYTGYSSSLDGQQPSLQASASGPITASFPNGALWIVSGETVSSRTGSNGETFLFISGAVGQWINVPNYNQAAADARYLRLAGGSMDGNITMNSNYKLVGTSSWAESASIATTALGMAGGSQYRVALWGTNTTLSSSIIYQHPTTNNIGINTNTSVDSGYKLDISGSTNISGNTTITGSFAVSSSTVIFKGIPVGTGQSNVILFDTASGQLYYTASSLIGGGGGTSVDNYLKAGTASIAEFAGTPYSASITFAASFASSSYSVAVMGVDARAWTVTDKATTGFTINSNSNTLLTGPVSWVATLPIAGATGGGGGGGTGTVTGTGNEGYIPLWFGSTTNLTNSNIYQNGSNNIGIGTVSPQSKLEVAGDIATSTGSLYVSSSIIYYGPFGNTDPGDNPLKIIQKSGWNADPGIVIGALNTIYTASSGVTVGGSNESYARGGANWIIGSSNYVTSSIYVVNNNYIFGYGNKVSGSSLTDYGGGAGNQVLIGRENISDMSTNGQAACILIGAFNNTNGYGGGGMYGSRLKYYANNQLAFGHNSSNVDFAIKDVFFGMGVRNEYTSVLSNNGLEGNGVNISINPSWAADEANRNAGSLNLNGGRGTGTGSAGDVIFATATTGSTGATLHSLTNRVWVKGHTGNVGIGTSTPSGSLHVSGTVYFSNLVTSSVALTNVLMISSSGQIFTTASSAIGGGGSPFTLTSGNGTTANGTAVDLGGTLTGNTDIDGNYKVSFGATTPLLQFNVAAGNNTLGMDSAGVGFGANLVALVGSNLIRMTGPTQVTGSLNTTGSVLFRGLTTSNQSNVVTIDTTTGQLYYTASSAIGGGGTGTGFPFSGNALITGSLLISGSGLTITGSVNISGSLNATASWAQSASNAVNAQTASYVLASNIVGSLTRIATGSVSASVNVATSSIFQLTSGSNTILNISNKGNTTLIGSGSATPILAVSGSQGDLFSVSDSLSGSLFAVNDTDGLPVLEAFSDGTVTIGSQTRPAIYTSVETVINSGTGQILYQIPTASCFGLFFDTIVKSGSQYSVGNAATVINSNTTDTAWYDSTPTNGASIDKFFGIIITGSYLAITGSSTPQSSTFRTDGWITRLIIRAI